MVLMNRILRAIAPSLALRRQIANDDWTKQMVLQIHMSFINDEHSKNTTTSNFLQRQPERIKDEMMRVVLDRINAVADSSDRKLGMSTLGARRGQSLRTRAISLCLHRLNSRGCQ